MKAPNLSWNLNRIEPRPKIADSAVLQAPEQLQSVMQEWLLPLVVKIGALEREPGHEQSRRQAAEEPPGVRAAVIENLRRRAESTEGKTAHLVAQFTERDWAFSQLHGLERATLSPGAK